jgi:hypothetical protein
MAENIIDESIGSTDQVFDQQPQMDTETVEAQQFQQPGSQTLPSNYLSQSSLYTDGKGKPLDGNPKARAAAANHLIQNKLPQPTSLAELVRRNRSIIDSNPLMQSGALSDGVYKESIVRRYDDEDYGFIPGADVDDFYGKREAWYEKTIGAVAFKLPTYIATKALQGAGFIGGLISPWNYGTEEGVISKAADNWLYKAMESFDDYTKNEWMPTFQEAADKEKGFWNRFATDGDFWTEDVVDGLAFMLSAWIPGMALSKLGLGAAALRGLGSASRVGAAGLGATVEGAEAIANYFTQAQKVAKGIDQFGTWALATASESMFEGKEVRDNVRNTLRNKIKPDGSYYSNDEINKIAGEAAKNTFLMNSVLLGATNVFQMKYFAKAFGAGEKTTVRAGILGGEGLASQAALSPTESALKYYGKVLGGGIAREGFIEENMQLAIQRINERYGAQGKVGSMLELATYADLLTQYGLQTAGAVKGTDEEAAMNIGLGGLLGGGSNLLLSRGERSRQMMSTEAAFSGYNDAQANWLKFGNVYKTEDVKTKDANGVEVINNKIIIDENNQPIIDEAKLHAAVTGLQATSDMLTDSQNSKNKYVKDYLRTEAFSEFVQAHISAGLETTLINKLDALKNAKPEDLAKLGFVADENLASEIDKHKTLASTIIKQNKILNESILFDGSKEDNARKKFLTNLAAKQAVGRHNLSFIDNDSIEAKNQFLTSENTSLSDGMVDQLNQILYRIESNKELMDYLKESGQDKVSPMGVYNSLTAELDKSLTDLIKNNEATVASLKKDENGFYQYEKTERNDPMTRGFLDMYSRKKGEMLNEIKTEGLKWAYYADNKDGKKNYVESFTAEVELVNAQKKQKEEEEKKFKEKEAEDLKKRDEEEGIVDKTPAEPGSETEVPPAPPAPVVTEEDPGLQQYLLDKYAAIIESTAEFTDTFEDWIKTGGANSTVRAYNKKFNKNEVIPGVIDDQNQGITDEEKQGLVDSLSIAETTKATTQKAISAIRKVYDKLKGDDTFISKVLDKIEGIKDEFVRIAIRAVFTGKPEVQDAEYISLADVDVYVNNKEHVGFDKVNINKDELETGFVLKGDKALIQSIASNLTSVNDRIKVVASRKYVNETQKKVEDANIPNRRTITYETPNEIANKLKRGMSVIAVSSKSQGFGTQIFNKNAENKNNIYIAGIENYAIVHPDNTTDAVTFSEEQREFVKKNMLVDGQQMTDAQYDRLQKIYNKVQDFNAEVELVLGENEEMDITPIFNQFFTVTKSGRTAEKGQSFESLIKDNPESLFTVMYQTETGETLEKEAALVTEKYGTSWVTNFVMNPGETLVYADEQSGEISPVTNFEQYFIDVHGINPQFNDNFKGGVYAWIAKVPSDSKGFKPYFLKKDKGTEPVAYFKKFADEFKELKKVLNEGAVSKEYKYKGQTFTTVNELMKYFNINSYGFYRAGDWNINMSYNPETKKFAFEFRPTNKQKRDSLDKTQKQALNLYFSDAPILSIDNSTEDQVVIDNYNTWIKNLRIGLGKLGEKLAESEDPVQRELRSMLDSKAMFFYEMENDKQNYFLKLVNKTEGRNIPVEFLSYAATNMSGNITVALNEEPVAAVKKKAVKPKPTAFVSLGTLNDSDVAGGQITKPDSKTATKATSGKTGRKIIKNLDDDAPFMLRSEEEYQRYSNESYNEEIQWLAKALKNSGINIKDLGSIIDKLSAKKQVLGYYKNRAIYVNSNLSAVGSIYHEGFHGLFRDIFTSDQRAFYLSKARGKMGVVTVDMIDEFRNDRNYFNKTNREIVDLMAEEYLAEGFRKYKLDQKEPADSWFKKFVKLFERIINFFDRNKKAIDDLYKDFDGGVYSEQVPIADNKISNEGVYALAYGRPKLVETTDEDTGESGFGVISKIPLNMEVQNELTSKLAFRVANMKEGSFASKFSRAVEELKSDYDIEALVGSNEPALADAIRNKYQNKFNEASFILGVPVRYVLDDSLINDEDANEIFTKAGDNQEAQDYIKDIVRQKIESLGLESGFSSDDIEVPQDEEDTQESEKGGEFDKVHINPLKGLTREFRNLFSIIPYKYTDPTLGVVLNRTADGNMLFNAMIKVASDKPIDQILPSLDKAVKMMEEDGDPKYAPLKAFSDFIQSQFGIADISDSTSKPTRNLFLYKQFIDTFFVTELPSYVIKSSSNILAGATAEVYDASINQDVAQKKEGIKFYYDQAYRKLSTAEDKAIFNSNFEKLQKYINASLFTYLTNSGINDRKSLNKVVNEVKDLMDNVNIVLPKNLIRQSLLAIYSLENKNTFNANSKQNIADMENDQRLMKEGAYLQGDFFNTLSQIKPQNYSNLFADTRDKSINFGSDYKRIDQLNKILKKASKYIIKYDINSSISVYQNAENKNIYRYTRYTPPILLTQLIREKGLETLKDMYPVLSSWMSDNSLFDGSLKNNLFLENLEMSSFGGIRQEIGDDVRNGVTFGSIDPRSFHLSSIVHFMNREKIVAKKKNDAGKTENVEIITFKRSRTQEEATTTNFLVTGMYDRYTTGNAANDKFVNGMIGFMRQEYNRVQREWMNKEKTNVRRYKDYNDTNEGRAYKFANFVHFFEQQKTTDTNTALREEMRDALLEAAKKGTSFEEAIKSDVMMQLPLQLAAYMDETFETYKDALVQYGILNKGKENSFNSNLIPKKIKEDIKDGTLEEFGYNDVIDMLKDLHLNIEMNKRMVNQIYDGDIATGISSAQNYYKRNKSGVISGNSMKTGYFRTAVINNLQSFIPTIVNPITGQVDFDLNSFSIDENLPETRAVDIADGQSYHTMNHRIRMMDSWGRLDTGVKAILQKAKYKKLTKKEIEYLDQRKVVLNTIKSATGGILEYYKLSEHLINRVDVSRLVIPADMTQAEVESTLDDLYTRIENLEDLIIEDPNTETEFEQEIEDLYSQVHDYWEPKRGREKLHFLLNSMEASGIDQSFDTNASKKTTLVPVQLQAAEITDLKASKSFTSGMFKFLQVETSGVKNRITLPSQARQLLTTYINKLDNDVVYRNKTLKELAQEYTNTLGDITSSATNMLDKALLDDKGNLDVSQLFNTMYNGLKKQGADSNTLKYFEVRDGKPVHNPNLPAIKKIFTYYYFSMFNDAIFSQKINGRSDILVSEYGYEVLYDTQDNNRVINQLEQDVNPQLYKDTDRFKTRHLGVSVEKVNGRNVYTIEVMIPEYLSKNESERELFLTKLAKFFSTRIPTEDRRSMIVAKVVDYLDASYQNSIVVPQLVHILAGSDLDVDKLFSHTFEHYLDYNDVAHVYGDYSKYASPSQGQFAEYIQYMSQHPSFKDLVQTELEKVAVKPVFTNDFLKVADQLGISLSEKTVEEIKEKRSDIQTDIEVIEKAKDALQAEHDIAFNTWISASKSNRSKESEEFLEKRAKYLMAKESLDAMSEDLDNVREELNKMNNTLKIAALVNILKSKNMPVTQSEFTKYTKSNPTPVIPVMNNESLQQKIDILSNEKVFKDFYINERSTVQPFKDIANSIGASVEDVVTKNSIYSIMGDVVANELNSSSKDGIGIAASFNKFLAFAEKNNVSLGGALLYDIDSEGRENSRSDFSNTAAIRRTGQSLGMFADASKEPIPSVLNLNPDTSGVSNVIMGMTGNLQFALLINKIPFIEEVTEEFRNQNSAIQDGNSFLAPGLKSMIKGKLKEMLADIEKNNRLSEIFEVDKEDKVIYGQYRPMYVKTVDANPGAALMNREDITLSDLGLELYYEDGTQVVEDVANAYLANTYTDIMTLTSEILQLGKILNLIKQQKPSFSELDQTIAAYDYFISGTSLFGDSIAKALKSSKEYTNLVKAAQKMSDYSRNILIERSPLFNSINSILNSGLSKTYRNDKAKENITDQIGKFVIINKIKNNIKTKIDQLKDKTDKKSISELSMLEESAKYFTADYWLTDNTFLDDLDYLYATNPGNPFVEFLKVNNRKGLDFLEATSRMKLDKDITENIINGYEALQKSKDDRSLRLSRQMFFYLLAKDGLGYGAYTFIKYVNPDIPQMTAVSDSLTDFQKLLSEQNAYIMKKRQLIDDIRNSGKKEDEKQALTKVVVKDIYKNYTNLFDKFFNNTTKPGQVDWINGIVNKIFSYAGNQKYIKQTYPIVAENIESKETITEAINAGVFSHVKEVKAFTGKKFDFIKSAPNVFTIDFTPLKTSTNPSIASVFSSFYPVADRFTNELRSVNFSLLLSDGEGKLFKLNKIDDAPISEAIALSSISPYGSVPNSGLKAEYVKLDIEGTNNLLNFGFSKQDGIKLYEKVRSLDDIDDLVRVGVDPSVLSELSDNKTKTEAPTNYADTLGPINVGNQQVIDDDAAIAEMLASGQLKGGKVGTATQQAPGEIGFKVIGEKAKEEFTPEKLTKENMPANGIFVFGSNDRGVHGLGAAKTAVEEFSAIRGQASGQQGKAFGIRTKMYQNNQLTKYTDLTSENKKVMDGMTVQDLNSLRLAAISNPTNKYYVTEIGTKLAGRTVEQMKDFFTRMNTTFGIPSNIVLPKSFEVRNEQNTPIKSQTGVSITYTPTGKQQQTYSVVGTQIFNKDNVEVFKENSTDRNKIFANVAVKTGRAVVVNHKGSSYVVNNRNQVISAKTGKIMQWDETNGDLIAILAEAAKMFAPAGVGITMKEIDDIYNQKSVKNVTLEQYRKNALEFIKTMSAAGMSKSAILEQLTCL